MNLPDARKRLSLFCPLLQTFVPGRRMMDLFDVEAAEKAEAELDDFVLKRSRSQEAANREEALWAESTRRFNQKRRKHNAREWLNFHDRQLKGHEATFGALVGHHRAERARYARVLGIDEPVDTETPGPLKGPPPPLTRLIGRRKVEVNNKVNNKINNKGGGG